MSYHRNYCADCSWRASTEEHSQHELTTLAIEHYRQTHHTIESEAVVELDTIPLRDSR